MSPMTKPLFTNGTKKSSRTCGKEVTQKWLCLRSPQIRGNSFIIHHSELRTLRPQRGLQARASVILFGTREAINFDNYEAIVSFVNVRNSHWKFLYINPAQSSVYLVDPFPISTELADSNNAAKRFSEYFKMRRICHSKCDWVDTKWKGAVMEHPVQQDCSSCGLVVIMMANKVMEAFPDMPNMDFGTTRKEMVHH